MASQSVLEESYRLYLHHLKFQIECAGLNYPFENQECLITPQYVTALEALADTFAASPQREWVYDQAETVDLDCLNLVTFHQLVRGVFQDGEATWEKVLILFYFCTDISMRVLEEESAECFIKVHNWIMLYIGRQLAVWVEQQGGWSVVFNTSPNFARNMSILGACCVGVLLICMYIRSR